MSRREENRPTSRQRVTFLLVVCTDVVVTAIGSVCWTDDIAVAILWVRDADVIKAPVGLWRRTDHGVVAFLIMILASTIITKHLIKGTRGREVTVVDGKMTGVVWTQVWSWGRAVCANGQSNHIWCVMILYRTRIGIESTDGHKSVGNTLSDTFWWWYFYC